MRNQGQNISGASDDVTRSTVLQSGFEFLSNSVSHTVAPETLEAQKQLARDTNTPPFCFTVFPLKSAKYNLLYEQNYVISYVGVVKE
jgi:hypothetical protein